MKPNRNSARIVGLLFLTATVSYMVGNGLIGSITNGPDYLLHVYPNKTLVIIGTLLELVNSAAVIGIAVVLFPILKQYSENIARGYVAFRVIEAILLMIGAISPLLLIILSQEFIAAGAHDTSYFQTLGMLAIHGKELTFQLAMIVLGLYSLLFCYLLYQSKLIPRLLSVIGFIGYACLSTSALMGIFGFSSGMILYLPGALFEIILPIWLIVKGFNLKIVKESIDLKENAS